MTRMLALLLIASTCGCSFAEFRRHVPALSAEPLPPPRAFRDASVTSGHVRRVLLLPLWDESDFGSGADVVNTAVLEEMAKLQRFRVVIPSPTDAALNASVGPDGTGRIPVPTIIDLGRRYGVDAVLFGSIVRYRPYDLPLLGMTVSLVDVETGRVLWSAQDFVDSSDVQAARSLDDYYYDVAARSDTVFGREVLRSSPRWFTRFCAQRIVRTLLENPPAPAEPAEPRATTAFLPFERNT